MKYIITENQIRGFERFLYQNERSRGTVEKYLRDLTSFRRFLGEQSVSKERVALWKGGACTKRLRRVHRQLYAHRSPLFFAFRRMAGMLRPSAETPAHRLLRRRKRTDERRVSSSAENSRKTGKSAPLSRDADDLLHRHTRFRIKIYFRILSERRKGGGGLQRKAPRYSAGAEAVPHAEGLLPAAEHPDGSCVHYEKR